MPLASATTLLCFVLAVSDGDTLRTLCEDGGAGRSAPTVVRLTGIDAPESNQAFGRRAKQAMASMVLHQEVMLRCRAEPDRYGRRLCQVMVAPASCQANSCAKTLDAGLALLTLGLAWWEPHYAWQQSPEERGRYEFAQTEAKAKRAGLWRDPAPVAPWDWRPAHPIGPRAQ